MSAPSTPSDNVFSEAPPPPPQAADAAKPLVPRLHSQISDILGSLRRLAELQAGIWLAGVKMAVLRLVILVIFCFLALLLTILAVVFLYAGLYHVLTDILRIPTAWALLIFAGGHLLLAGILVGVAIFLVNRLSPQDKTSGGAP